MYTGFTPFSYISDKTGQSYACLRVHFPYSDTALKAQLEDMSIHWTRMESTITSSFREGKVGKQAAAPAGIQRPVTMHMLRHSYALCHKIDVCLLRVMEILTYIWESDESCVNTDVLGHAIGTVQTLKRQADNKL